MRIPSFKSMSIATRLTLGFVSVLVLLAGVAATSNIAMRMVSGQMQQIVEVNNLKIELASGMLNSINQIGLHTRTVALLYDAKLIQQESGAAEAAAAAYLHPLANATQVRHILGAAAHAARAVELAAGDDPVVAEYALTASAGRATPDVLTVLARYPRAPSGGGRVGAHIRRLDSLLRDPPPPPRVVDDPGPFFHGTRADLRPGDLLTPGRRSNYGSGRRANHIYVTASRDGAPLAAVMARGAGEPRVYRVEPLGTIEDDPNVTDKRFPGNPTRSYRTTEPVRVVEEIVDFTPPPQELVTRLHQRMAELADLGIEAMDD